MNKSENISQLATALAKAQQELEPVKFDSLNKYFGTKYASLTAVIEAIRPVLPKYGLSIIQQQFSDIVNDVYVVGVETMLLHESGEFLSEKATMPVMPMGLMEKYTYRTNRDGDVYYTSPNVLQEVGKVVTYLRRYGIVSVLRLSAEEDIDGNSTEQQKATESTYGKAADKQTIKSDDVTTENVTKSKPAAKRPYAPEDLKKALVTTSTRVDPATDKDRQVLAAVLSQFTENDDQRHKIQKFLFGAESLKDVEPRMVTAALRWLNPYYEEGEYLVAEHVAKELEAVYQQVLEQTEEF